jgi:hypothetical protein
MPRFFLHIVRGDQRIEDPEGEDLADLASARDSAAESSFDLTVEQLRRTGKIVEVAIEIADEQGKVLETVSFPPNTQ